jgi:nitrous oxide reductase
MSYFKLVLNKLKVTWIDFFLCIHYWGPSLRKNISKYFEIFQKYFKLIQDVSKYLKIFLNISKNLLTSFPNYIMDLKRMNFIHVYKNEIHPWCWWCARNDTNNDIGNDVGHDIRDVIHNNKFMMDKIKFRINYIFCAPLSCH